MWSTSRLAVLSGIVFVGVFASACGTQSINPSGADKVPVTPTATPLPTISLKSPILGGSFQAFYNLFDHNSTGCPNFWVYQMKEGSTCIDLHWPDKTIYKPDDFNTRITGIDIIPDTHWNVTQEQQALTQFMPPDAKYVSTKTVYLGPSLAGIEKTYTSVLLARTLPKADFLDVNGKQTQPGTFFLYLVNGLGAGENIVLGTDESYALLYNGG